MIAVAVRFIVTKETDPNVFPVLSLCSLLFAGPNQVKVLVDLAMITASGQGDIEVQKVRCLQSATMGYASLIYDLDPEKSTFQDFYGNCENVWKALEADPKLPQKLVSNSQKQLQLVVGKSTSVDRGFII